MIPVNTCGPDIIIKSFHSRKAPGLPPMCQSGARLSHLSSKGCVISPKGSPAGPTSPFPLQQSIV